tara:strand:+ start:583 stop:795 length:213 start_codon:yes stop_codon:yes gene_type:complete
MNGEKLNCKITEVTFEVGSDKAPQKFKANALISNSQRIILGRKDFFEKFRITFDEINKRVDLKPCKKKFF